MTKQYGIDPRLVTWIRNNMGHDPQTFSDLAKIKRLDSRKRNGQTSGSLPTCSWMTIKENDFSLIGEMTRLQQLCLHDVVINIIRF